MNNTYFEQTRFKEKERRHKNVDFRRHAVELIEREGTKIAGEIDQRIECAKDDLKDAWQRRTRNTSGRVYGYSFGTHRGGSMYDETVHTVLIREEIRILAYQLFYLKKLRREVNRLIAVEKPVTMVSSVWWQENPEPEKVDSTNAIRLGGIMPEGGFAKGELGTVVGGSKGDEAQPDVSTHLLPNWWNT